MAFTTDTSSVVLEVASTYRPIETARLTAPVSREKTRSETGALRKMTSSDR